LTTAAGVLSNDPDGNPACGRRAVGVWWALCDAI